MNSDIWVRTFSSRPSGGMWLIKAAPIWNTVFTTGNPGAHLYIKKLRFRINSDLKHSRLIVGVFTAPTFLSDFNSYIEYSDTGDSGYHDSDVIIDLCKPWRNFPVYPTTESDLAIINLATVNYTPANRIVVDAFVRPITISSALNSVTVNVPSTSLNAVGQISHQLLCDDESPSDNTAELAVLPGCALDSVTLNVPITSNNPVVQISQQMPAYRMQMYYRDDVLTSVSEQALQQAQNQESTTPNPPVTKYP